MASGLSREMIGALLQLKLEIAHKALEAKNPALLQRIKLTEQTNTLLRRSK